MTDYEHAIEVVSDMAEHIRDRRGVNRAEIERFVNLDVERASLQDEYNRVFARLTPSERVAIVQFGWSIADVERIRIGAQFQLTA